ncbi:MAG: DNA cytosine methyltransferase, partial [Pseudomonadota bacterium]
MTAPLIIDSFAGGGGASAGMMAAFGRSPDIAINHCDVAMSMHAANHPETLHLPENIWQVNIDEYTARRKVGFLWASPDCRHFSRARGGKPISKSVRGLAWSIVKFVHELRDNTPDVIALENVCEFLTWEEFPKWKRALRKYGYRMEHRVLKFCDYGVPTIRKRLFIIMRRDGKKIVWPEQTHGDPKSDTVQTSKLLPWKTSGHDVIDWSIPCPSIFDTSEQIMAKYGVRAVRPLVEATCKRIAAGVVRYVLEAEEPFFVTMGQHGGGSRSALNPMHTITASTKDQNAVVVPNLVSLANMSDAGKREYPVTEPLTTVTGTSEKALVACHISRQFGASIGHAADQPLGTVTANGGGKSAMVAATMVQSGYGEREGQAPRTLDIEAPLGTVVAGGCKHALVAAFLAQHNTQRSGVNPGRAAELPISTITGTGTQQNVVAAHMINLKGSDRRMARCDEPLQTICAGGTHAGLVAAFLTKYYGTLQAPWLTEPLHTVTTKDRFSLVTCHIQGEPYIITDIGMRMLTPRELYRAQGFPEDYIIDRGEDGKPITKTEQIRKCGNSVSPILAEAIAKANCP